MRKRSQPLTGAANSDRIPCRMHFAPCLPEPERIVGLGFRYWSIGRQTGDISAWENAWNLYAKTFGLCGARQAVTSLSSWVNAMHRSTHRDIEVFPQECKGFCRDECIAVSMIAACQHNTCPAMRACALALVDSTAIDQVVHEAQEFADTMLGLKQRLCPPSIVAVSSSIEAATLATIDLATVRGRA